MRDVVANAREVNSEALHHNPHAMADVHVRVVVVVVVDACCVTTNLSDVLVCQVNDD